MSNLTTFIAKANEVYSSRVATEHSYRAALAQLIIEYDDRIAVINEPKRLGFGAPDLLIRLNDLTIGYLEQKDIAVGLTNFSAGNKAQQERYLNALPNLIYTNCLDWNFYRNGKLVGSVSVAEISSNKIKLKTENTSKFEFHLRDFLHHIPQQISNPRDLAIRMADKTNLVSQIILQTLKREEPDNSSLHAQYDYVKEKLIHDLTIDEFADMYAETVAFGLLTARLHVKDTGKFNRRNVGDLLPKSNPFLRGLFSIISGEELGDSISWVIDDLAEIFDVCDMNAIMEGFGELAGQNDPFLHFYETFLKQFNPEKRNSKGVWYTPEPIVKFITRSVDKVLTTEFGLRQGLADVSKVSFSSDDKQLEAHRVQILDPATGTGTFLAEIIKQIALKVKTKAPSMWHKYIEQHLIPRIHGFEILMAPYAVCHLKLELILKELGYEPSKSKERFSVFLTNAIEKGESIEETLGFARWLSNESQGATKIKKGLPIMCVIGNPPYNAEDGAAEGWMGDLMKSYKSEPDTNEKVRLKEDNPKAINDLYVKFVRMASHLIENNEEGVLAFITNHGYLDNIVFRGMRWHLLHTFDKIWVLDLHGNAKRKEIGPDGNRDQNVFDIATGVSIIIAVKSKNSNGKLATIFLGDLWGSRETKYSILESEDIYGDMFEEIHPQGPEYFFEKIDYKNFQRYGSGFCLNELFSIKSDGIVTSRDAFAIDTDKEILSDRLKKFISMKPDEARSSFNIGEDTYYWKIHLAQADIGEFDSNKLVKMCYRPFDERWTYYTGNHHGIISTPRTNVMQHLMADENIALLSCRQQGKPGFQHVFVTNLISSKIVLSNLSKEGSKIFPLYTYESDFGEMKKSLNYTDQIYDKVRELAISQEFGEPDEIAVFDYIYGVLHCPEYRSMFAEYLRKDFPKIPYPTSSEIFWNVSSKGSRLRMLHLMTNEEIGESPINLSEGSNEINKVEFKGGKVWINDSQYFSNVPEISWSFKIGGYKPAEKWLKDRKDRLLDFEMSQHYINILKVLLTTDSIMKEISIPLTD